jgi:hypothetical protein
MFTSKISKKAWAIYREICPKKENEISQDKEAKKLERRNYFAQAVKAAYEYYKAVKNGVVRFIKILDMVTGESKIEERKVMSLEQYEYKKKTDRVPKASQFVFIDVEKAFVGKVREFISFHVSQLVW